LERSRAGVALLLCAFAASLLLVAGCNIWHGGDSNAMPALRHAQPPVALRDLKLVLDRELASQLESGLLSKGSGGALVIGVLDHGKRRIFTYGAAQPNLIFEIGSITKTFTGLLLAQMVVQQKVTLAEPVRELLPAAFISKSSGPEITLLDLATQHSGLPRDPANLKPADSSDPWADYGPQQLSEFLNQHGLIKPANAKSQYSNVGFGLLGYALSRRAGITYEELVKEEISGPLGMHDTAITLSSEQHERLVQGYDASFNQARPWNFDVIAGAGAIRSTAPDMLKFLEANLHPEEYAVGTVPGSPAATLPAAIAIDHEPRAEAPEVNGEIALAWFVSPKRPVWLDHNGGTGGYSSFTRFCPEQDWGYIVLYNRDSPDPRFVDLVGVHITQLLMGQPTIPLDFISTADRHALAAKVVRR